MVGKYSSWVSVDTLFINDAKPVNLQVNSMAVSKLRSSIFLNFLNYIFLMATLLFFIASPGVLRLINWQYLGGGPEFEKIHIATYLLVTTFVCMWLSDAR